MTRPTMTHPALPRRRILALAAALPVAGLVLTGCGSGPSESVSPATSTPPGAAKSADELLAEHGLSGLGTAQLVDRLDALPVAERPRDLIASVRPDSLVLTDGEGRETRMPMPEDRFYVSVAPYQEQTHECHFHSLTTCLGELARAEIRVTLVRDDGAVLLDEVRETFANGFTGLWVPRGIEATLTIEYDGRSGTAPVSTVEREDPTCITTLRLS
ncbi:CueP family metal-binding protein [Nocardioides carbamazepini]|uniref:CueP family metal-binding protein n=1 Tax=Nocardioides carbamazepini TaxID=2854259 RepID=UPI002149B089|nr:CueP family metal-binding protein [Nocardioides carbamazepini]MCR1782302.1 CueP family metal-binding protein [Nocardioides carbamazepini]